MFFLILQKLLSLFNDKNQTYPLLELFGYHLMKINLKI